MKKVNTVITNIHENKRFPGVVYAELREKDGQLVIAATLEYIFDALRERQYECENVTLDEYGNYHVKTVPAGTLTVECT